jgi:hypothetical protein
VGNAPDLNAFYLIAIAGGQPLRQGLGDRAFRPEIVAPDVAAFWRAGLHTAVLVGPLEFKHCALHRFVFHAVETLKRMA